jgi:hypothetical protein
MKQGIRMTFKWADWYDWIIFPSIMIGFRSYGIGIAFIFLKIKAELIIQWGENYMEGVE